MKYDFTLLQKANINKREAAQLLGVTPTTISLWTTKGRQPIHLIADKVTALLDAIERDLKTGLLPIPDWRSPKARWEAISKWYSESVK